MILYEYPFNERIRTYLRLEHLFLRLVELIPRTHPLDHHYAIQTLFEIMDVGARSDLKSEILKDLERHRQVYNSYRGNPAISEAALDQFISQLDSCYSALIDDAGKTGHALTENEWLMAIRSRISIPGGTCEFDLPAYHDWLHRPAEERQSDLAQWAHQLASLSAPVHLLMRLLRDNGAPQMVVAQGGQFQQNLPQGRTFQLLRLRLDPSLNLIPEISGNRLLFSVRLQRRGEDGKLHLSAAQDTELEVTLCS
ncbi:MAG TPA: cell division protein ZapD [Macromonas sp.]|nr:cell division protein ZapD [Macromonas sp.]